MQFSEMNEIHIYRANLLNRFGSVVDELRQSSALLSSKDWHLPFGEQGRSPHWTLSHLAAIETQALAERIRRVAVEELPLLTLFDDEGWMAEHYNLTAPWEKLLDEYARARQEELALLHTLPAAAWNRQSRHPWFGQRTLQWWVEKCLWYSKEHLKQIEPKETR